MKLHEHLAVQLSCLWEYRLSLGISAVSGNISSLLEYQLSLGISGNIWEYQLSLGISLLESLEWKTPWVY